MKQLITLMIGFIFVFGLHAQNEGQTTTTTNSEGVSANYALEKGDNLIGLDFSLSYQGGKNKFDNDNTDKPSNIGVGTELNYLRLVSDKFAVGGSFGYDVDISKSNNGSDQKFTMTSYWGGPTIAAFQPLGDDDRGGFYEKANVYAGCTGDKFSDESFEETNKAMIVGANIGVGGYYNICECILISAYMGLIGFETTIMKQDDPQPDMVTTDFNMAWKSQNITLGVKYNF